VAGRYQFRNTIAIRGGNKVASILPTILGDAGCPSPEPQPTRLTAADALATAEGTPGRLRQRAGAASRVGPRPDPLQGKEEELEVGRRDRRAEGRARVCETDWAGAGSGCTAPGFPDTRGGCQGMAPVTIVEPGATVGPGRLAVKWPERRASLCRALPRFALGDPSIPGDCTHPGGVLGAAPPANVVAALVLWP
jgi:hypothetical protein